MTGHPIKTYFENHAAKLHAGQGSDWSTGQGKGSANPGRDSHALSDCSSLQGYDDRLQLELPAYLAQWLVDPVFVPDNHILVYTVQEDGSVKTGIEREFDV